MYPPPAVSALEQMWADEVRRLHSLWHLGPPRPPADPRPDRRSGASASGLGASASTAFKRSERRRRRREERMERRVAKKLEEQLNLCNEGPRASDGTREAASSEVEWPCETPPANVPERGWDDPNRTQAATPAPAPPASDEDQRRLAGMRLHQRAMKVCRDFFSPEGSSDVDDEDEEEDDPMDEDEEGSRSGRGQGGCVYFDFFLGLFEKDGELRAYYEKNWEKGEFSCVVCAGIEAKAAKRYGDCVALVQHSCSVAKTKRKEAHRAFGRAICRVLGWDIARLPSIVLDVGETLGQVLTKATGLQGDGVHKQNGENSVEIPQSGGTDDAVHKQNQNGLVKVLQPDGPGYGVLGQNGEILVEVSQPGGTDDRILILD